MKLFFDARWTRTDYHDGISRYTSGLLEGFMRQNLPVTALICDIKQLELLPKGVPYLLLNHPVSPKEPFIARRLNRAGADVVFSPLQVMGFWGRKYKLILTLQDIIYYRHPKPPTNLPWYVRTAWRLFHMARWPQRLLLNRADYVTTVSHTSKRFIEEMGLTKNEIGVIYNATSAAIAPNEAAPKEGPTKNILYMGSFMPYKNTEALIRALGYLPNDYALHLLSKISPQRKNELQALIPEGAQIVFHNGISEAAYAQLLMNAHCLATASKEEGFGLPIAEAQTYGTPVVCTDMDIFREVAGEGALYCNPDEPKEFASAIESLAQEDTRTALIEKGRTHTAQFNWESSAREIWNIAEKITEKS